MNLSYQILHYERPYFLELAYKMMRRFCPEVEIVISDDGSEQEVVNKIKSWSPDHFFKVKRHIEVTKGTGSSSDAINGGLQLCSQPYYLFGEDDLLYAAKFVEANVSAKMHVHGKSHSFFFNDLKGNQPLVTAISKFEDPNVALVQLNRATYDAQGEKLDPAGPWPVHDLSTKNVYNNRPFIMKTEERRQLELGSGLSIYTVQRRIEEQVRAKLANRKGMSSPTSCFIHIGGHITTNIFTGERARHFQKVWSNFCNLPSKHEIKAEVRAGKNRMISLYQKLSALYLNGKFFIDFDEMLEKGFDHAFAAAANRIKTELEGI